MITQEKIHFHDLGTQCLEIDWNAVARQAGVPDYVIREMMTGVPIKRGCAESVLSALSSQTGEQWTLKNVAVVLLPDSWLSCQGCPDPEACYNNSQTCKKEKDKNG